MASAHWKFLKNKTTAAVIIAFIGSLLALAAGQLDFVGTLERQTLDMRFRSSAGTSPRTADIVVVDINERSIVDLEPDFGRWPWPRNAHAVLIDYLTRSGAKAIIFDVLFSERTARKEVGKESIDRLRQLASSVGHGDRTAISKLDEEISALDPAAGDDALSRMTKSAGNVIYSLILKHPGSDHAPARPGDSVSVDTRLELVQPFVLRQRASEAIASGALSRDAVYEDATLPLSDLIRATSGLGHTNYFPDPDGPARSTYPIVAWRDHLIPSLPLAAVALGCNVSIADIRIEPGRLIIGDRVAPLDSKGRMLILYHGSKNLSETNMSVYRYCPYVDVLLSQILMQRGKAPLVPAELFKDKIVFVGTSAAGLSDLRATPFSAITPGVEIHCHVADDILSNQFLSLPPQWYEPLAVFALALAVSIGGMYFRTSIGFLFVAGVGVLYNAAAFQALPRAGMWIEIVVPTLAIVSSYLLLILYRYMTEQREKRQIRGAMGRYLSPAVLEEILSDPAKLRLGGERCSVTILFSDLVGFTSLSEHLPPEDVAAILNEYLTQMTECVFRNGGTLDKFIGDALMAEFGAPVPKADHAARGCRAALDMLESLDVLQKKWQAEGRVKLTCRIGIHSGDAVVGNMGSDQLFDYTALGNTVNTAARLEPLCRDFGVDCLISGATVEEAMRDDKDFVARPVADVIVKGRDTALPVFELKGRKSSVSAETLSVLALFAEGYEHYRARRFADAREKFAAAMAINPFDGPSKTYARLSDEMIKSSPSAEWQGIYEQKSK